MGSMKTLFLGAVAVLSMSLLSSCSLVPAGDLLDDDHTKADARMEHIAEALNSHDAAAIKGMFSPVALEQATDTDERLDDLFALFPDGGLTWEPDTVNSEGSDGYGTELLKAYYKVSADGSDYLLFFADFTVNETVDPENVGIYALGIFPWFEGIPSGPPEAFSIWAGSMTIDESNENGYPGVYAGYNNEQLSSQRMSQIVEELSTQDNLGLEERFSDKARAEHAVEIREGIDELLALFSAGEVVAEAQQDAPVVRESAENVQKQLMLLSTYRISAGGTSYWLVCADFREDAADPTNHGIYAIGVALRTSSGDSAAEQALFSWANSLDIDGSVPPGIFIST